LKLAESRARSRHAGLAHVTSPAPVQAWQRLLEGRRDVLVTQTPDWLDCVCAISGYADASRLYEFHDGHLAVVPLVRRLHLPPRWATTASWPFDWGIGGPLATPGFGGAHARTVLNDLDGQPALRTALRLNPFSAELWHGTTPTRFRATNHTTYVLDLRDGFPEVWKSRFRSSVRRAVRKAERAGLRVEVDHTGDLVPVFYHLYEQSIARWAAQAHEPLRLARLRARRANPERKLQYVARRFGDDCSTWVAWRDEEPVAAIIVLQRGLHSKYWRGAMNQPLASPSRANDLLHRLAIEQACEAGCAYYHMGDSRPGSSLAAFKAGFGAQPMPSWSLFRERLPISVCQQGVRRLVKAGLRYRDP
jgi:hypothetical protein